MGATWRMTNFEVESGSTLEYCAQQYHRVSAICDINQHSFLKYSGFGRNVLVQTVESVLLYRVATQRDCKRYGR